MSAVITHLWSSTLVLALALVAARFLPLTARTRYVLLLVGLAKFALPSELLLAPVRWAGVEPPPGVISMQWLGGPVTLPAAAPAESLDWRWILAAIWIGSAVLLAVVWAVARHRLVASALRSMAVASPRERQALTAARHRLGLRASIDIRRSTICEAPAVVRLIRPVVVLPDGGLDALDDDELESLLRHECAHVARRDNLAGLLESAIVSAFWFHPLVWVAQRAIARAREEACDELAAATAESVDTYVSALTKICRAVLAPRLAGVSCMASGHLNERLRHLMSFETLRTRALSHGLVTALATVAVLFVAVASGLEASPSADTNGDRYKLIWSVKAGDAPDRWIFNGRVIDTDSGVVLAEPGVQFERGAKASVKSEDGKRTVQLDLRDAGASIEIEMRILENGVTRQVSQYVAPPLADTARRNTSGRRYTGEPISMTLRDADVKDVLNQFAALTGTQIHYSPNLQGQVTVDVKDMPWDEAFDLVLRQNGLEFELREGAIYVK